jgi:hypothetical protein
VDDRGRIVASVDPFHSHPDLDEYHHDARVLADGPVSFGAHAGVGENLRNRIARRGTLFERIGAPHGLDEIGRVIVGNVLQSVGNTRDDIGFADHGHVFLPCG